MVEVWRKTMDKHRGATQTPIEINIEEKALTKKPYYT